MGRNRWRQIEELYHAALERAPDERVAFLIEACAGDSGLRREVEELLGYDGAAGSFIEGNALAFEARQLEVDGFALIGRYGRTIPSPGVLYFRCLQTEVSYEFQ